LITNQFTKQKS